MKQKKLLISGFFFFSLLIGGDFVFHHHYHKYASARYETCLERKGFDCFDVKSVGDLVFSSATASHILTYFVIFISFILLSANLDKTEKRLKALEDRRNV